MSDHFFLQKWESRSAGKKIITGIRAFMLVILAACIVFGLLARHEDVASYFFVSAFTSFVTLVLTFVPQFISHRMSIVIPVGFQAVLVIFILLAEFFGEILRFYDRFWWWDVMLHASSGVLLGIMGVLVVYSLNFENNVINKMHPATIMLFAFCFALTCGAVWELFEFLGDYILGMNMQKSVYIFSEMGTEQFSGEAVKYLDENVRFYKNLPEGQTGRVFDPGLKDTMEDLLVDTIGALVAVLITSTYMKHIIDNED